MTKNSLALPFAVLWIAYAGLPRVWSADLAGSKKVDFIHEIQPILRDSCYQCHGAEKKKGGLRLDLKALALKGGENGPAIVPGQSEKSSLVQRLVSRDEDERMPQKAEPLPPEKISLIRDWIDQGANWPEVVSGTSQDPAKHWAYQPLAKIVPPKVTDSAWVRTPIDQFILAKLEEKHLRPNPPAERRNLIRRAYFDLLGLPPSPEEIEAFVNDPSPDAYPQLLDHLLASPHYGERWARHWLDTARFGESHGFEQDYDRPFAYWYRDFVIKALNDDMPYDQFIQWQLAGDEFAPDNPWALTATGFLGAGVFPTQLTEAEFEPSRYDELDNMASTTGTAMLGLTIGCARCHDHKFDPIPAKDYYRFITTFATTIRSEIDLDFAPEKYRLAKAKFDQEQAPLVAARQKFEQEQLPHRFTHWLEATPEMSLANPVWTLLALDDLQSKSGATLTQLDDSSVLASGKNPDNDTYTLIAHTMATNLTGIRIEALPHHSLVKGGPGRADNGNFHLTELRVSATPLKGDAKPTELKLTRPRSTFEQSAALAVSKVIDGDKKSGWAIDPQFGRNHAAVFEIENSPSFDGGAKLTITLEFNGNKRHGIGRLRVAMATAPGTLELAGDAKPQKVVEIFSQLEMAGGDRRLTDEQRQVVMAWYRTLDPDWQKLDAAIQEHLRYEPKPDLKKVMVTSEGFKPIPHHADDRGFPHFYAKTFFLKRGDTRQKGEEMTPGFLQILNHAADGDQHWQESPPMGQRTSWRRHALASWITDTENGAGDLLARVAVNRLWQHHFGIGIVATPNDFGTQGARPSHPELLDWLANDLMEHRWNLKRLHKLIMTSATYRQGIQRDPDRAALDPDNKLLWRRDRQRLEAEVIRDSMLKICGLLDERLFGPGTLDSKMRRRSIYFFIKRSQFIPILQLFDAPDPSVSVGSRVSTTVAPQALLFMNNPNVREYSSALAIRLKPSLDKSVSESVREGYLRTLGRAPTEREAESSSAFIKRQVEAYRADGQPDAEGKALSDFCQVLFGLNEFIYIE